jgi:hypothetical protein
MRKIRKSKTEANNAVKDERDPWTPAPTNWFGVRPKLDVEEVRTEWNDKSCYKCE